MWKAIVRSIWSGLKRQGIALLVCDIDNTLVPHDHARADDDVRAFIKRVKDSGLAVGVCLKQCKGARRDLCQ